jgi:L-cysteine S-thiosulfotransferase
VKNLNTSIRLSLGVGATVAGVLLAGCASQATSPSLSSAELDKQAKEMIKASFRGEGIASADRISQDLSQSACSSDKAPADSVAKQIESTSLASVKWPTNGVYTGDWKEGEKLAQSGRGMTWTDPTAETKNNGGNCYNCHEIDRKELSYGTIGPSLWNYGKLRGVKALADPASAPIVQYTWGKLWNSKAYTACSNMPRFGHMKILDENQIRHIMALLLDPASPVNR